MLVGLRRCDSLPRLMSSSGAPAHRHLYLPSPDFNTRKIPVVRQPARNWFRIHRTGLSAIDFGVRAHHRFPHPKSPFPLLYMGSQISTCLWEYFGDDVFQGNRVIAEGKWNGCSLSRIEVPELNVCALGQSRTLGVMGVDKGSLLTADIRVPQAWALAIQTHPKGFEAIKYTSRFIDHPCLALLDRSGMAGRLRETLLGPLKSLDSAVDWLDERQASLV